LNLLRVIKVRFPRGIRCFIRLLLVNIKFFAQTFIVKSQFLLVLVLLKLSMLRCDVSVAVVVVVDGDIVVAWWLGLRFWRLLDYTWHEHRGCEVMVL
jgi:hypothetical protein